MGGDDGFVGHIHDEVSTDCVVNNVNTPSSHSGLIAIGLQSLHILHPMSIHYLSVGTTRKCERDVGKESRQVVAPRPGFICVEQSTRWRVRSRGARGGN